MNKHLLSQLSELVAKQSVSSTNEQLDCSNMQVIETLANWLGSAGFQCHVQALNTSNSTTNNKANLIATYAGTKTNSDGLVLAGHTDTVPFNPELWQQDPLKLTQRDNKFFALGATDMKGFFPVAMAAVEMVKQQAGQPKKPITLIATADEESTMNGARALSNELIGQPSYAIIGEPTLLKPIRMHKGIMMNRIRVQGKSGHSSNPKLGINAMEIMNKVINELLQWREQLQQRHQNSSFEIAMPTMNLGCIHGGDNPNRICGHCYMEFDLRPLPGMPLKQLLEHIDVLLEPIAKAYQTQIELTPMVAGVEAFEQSCHGKMIQYIEQISEPSDSVAFATEAPFMQQLGMETVVWGPGSIDQAHSPNEYIDYSQMHLGIDLYAKVINQLCY